MASSRPVPNSHTHGHVHALLHRKKRATGGHAITANAGLAAGGILDDLDDEPPFISSSRDASEEDNDDASGYSDSASSLRASHQREASMTRSGSGASGAALGAQMSGFPTSARDKALVDSKPASAAPTAAIGQKQQQHQYSADKTPASSSPPLAAARDDSGLAASMAYASIGAEAYANPARRSSAQRCSQKESSAIRSTLNQAAAALTSASSTDLVPRSAHDTALSAGTAEIPPMAITHGTMMPAGQVKVHSSLRRVSSSSSAGSDYPGTAGATVENRIDEERKGESSASGDDRARRSGKPAGSVSVAAGSAAGGAGSHPLNLGALPITAATAQGGVTPKAELSNQLKPIAPALSGTSSRPAARTRSLSGVLSGAETETLADVSANSGRSEGTALEERSGYVDPDGTTPYDGDVEFAARTTVTQQIALGGAVPVSNSASASNVSNKPAAAAEVAVAGTGAAVASSCVPRNLFGSAPEDVGSSSWDAAPGQTQLEQDQGAIQKASVDEIRAYFRDAIYAPKEGLRDYKIIHPPDGGNNPNRPVRIYADGVYDLFHYAHALQLRQAKLAFPHVHLIVGVCSSANCAQHKNEPMLTSAERYEAVRNCRWVDEVLEDAPWVIDQALIDKLKVDYVAHDEDPYAGSAAAGGGGGASKDIYAFVKEQGKFLPTRRTPGVSTSDLLARIVDIYRHHGLDQKLEKIGKAALAFE